MEFFRNILLKIIDKKKYYQLREKKKIEKSINIFKSKIESKIHNISNNIKNKKVLNFSHSGHCGDIVCSLPVIKELSKTHECNLYLNLNKKMPVPYYKHPAGNVYMDNRIYNLIQPLLAQQKFLKKVSILKNEKIDIDLDLFREMPINLNFNSCRWFFHLTGIHVDLTNQYLFAEEHKNLKDKIIIHRTFRYRNNFIDYKFLSELNNIYFIGVKEEYDDLKKDIKNLNFYECKDYYDMANIIYSSKLFIGNSSIGYPIAEALKIPRLLEACPDFPVMQPSGKNGFDFYYQEHFEKLFHYLNKRYTKDN